MFRRLIASQPRSAQRGRTGPGLVALLGHGAVVAGAVVGTLRATDPPRVIPTVITPWQEPLARAERSGVPAAPPAPLTDPVRVPVEIPTDLPPIEDSRPLDPASCIGCPSIPGASDRTVGGDEYWSSALVEEPPVLLAGRPPAYPEPLRAAGIAGRVVVQAVIDTLGHAERDETVVESSDAGFEPAALDYVRHAVFRPGRVHGRRVRVLIRLPVDFRLTSVQ
jgi:periplasmic protein TonB